MTVIVDNVACQRLASLLAGFTIPAPVEESGTDGLTRAEKSHFHLLSVAICHQTQTLRGIIDGVKVRGWDYLTRKLLARIRAQEFSVLPEDWRSVTVESLTRLYEDAVYGSTLSDVSQRAALIRDLSSTMSERGWSTVDDLFTESVGAISSPNGLLSLLEAFHAFDDPVCKKSYFFLGLMRSDGVWVYTDPENLGPPVDYHEVRGHLRYGTVRILDAALKQRVMDRQPVGERDDVAIRQAVHDAIMSISRFRGLPDPMTLHYVFWNLFRSVCTRENPWCAPRADAPDISNRYAHLLTRTAAGPCCPLRSDCQSATAAVRPVEHRFSTHWY